MVENCRNLIVYSSHICVGVTLFANLVLPIYYVFLRYVAKEHISKSRQNVLFYYVLFGEPSAFFQLRRNIAFVHFYKAVHRHFRIRTILQAELPLPILRVAFGFKATLELFLLDTFSV